MNIELEGVKYFRDTCVSFLDRGYGDSASGLRDEVGLALLLQKLNKQSL